MDKKEKVCKWGKSISFFFFTIACLQQATT